MQKHDLLATERGRRGLFAILYLTEGAPIGFVWWALPTILRAQGIEIDSITTLTTLATLPWILKFLIAPAIDVSLGKGGSAKRWILVCQFVMALSLAPLLFFQWSTSLGLLIAVIVVHAAFAAVQDVSIDTFAIRTVPRQELGRINGWMQAGMLAGRAGTAALTTAMASLLGDPRPAVLVLIVVIALPAAVLILAVPDREPRAQPAARTPAISLKPLLSGTLFAGMLIALTVGGGFEFFGVSAGPRLLDTGNAEATVSVFFGLLAPAGLAAGALAGGSICDRIGALQATLLGFGAVTATLCYVALSHLGLFGLPIAGLVGFTAVYVGIGLLTASSYALFMSLARGPMTATKFSMLMAMTNACEAWSGFTGGRLAAVDGYGSAVLTMTLASCVALLPMAILWRLSAAPAGKTAALTARPGQAPS
jgi:MFS family permease